MSDRNYWIGIAAKDHVDAASAGSFAQVNRGNAAPPRAAARRRRLRLLSPRIAFPMANAAGVHRDRPRSNRTGLSATIDADFHPFPRRRRLPSLTTGADQAVDRGTVVHPQQGALGRGIPFRHARVPEIDFALIAAAMGCSLEQIAPQEPVAAASALSDVV
jgi:hypothetical protein